MMKTIYYTMNTEIDIRDTTVTIDSLAKIHDAIDDALRGKVSAYEVIGFLQHETHDILTKVNALEDMEE